MTSSKQVSQAGMSADSLLTTNRIGIVSYDDARHGLLLANACDDTIVLGEGANAM